MEKNGRARNWGPTARGKSRKSWPSMAPERTWSSPDSTLFPPACFGCRPCPADSLFFVKQKWGAEVREHGEIAFEFLIHWESANDRVVRFLEKTPLIFLEHGGLSVIGTADSESALRWREAGLTRYHAVGAENLKIPI